MKMPIDRSSDAFRDIQATSVMYMLTKYEALNKLTERSIIQQEIITDLSLSIQAQSVPNLDNTLIDIANSVENMDTKLDALSEIFGSLPEWIPANTLKESTGLTVDAIRKQLQNPALFEPEVDCKQMGRIWYIHKNSIAKIRRQK